MVENNIVSAVSPEPSIIIMTNGTPPADGTKVREPWLPPRRLHIPDDEDMESFDKSPKAADRLLKTVFEKGGFSVFPRGMRYLKDDPLMSGLNWTRKSPPNYLERAHVLIGRTIDEGRVQDAVATAKLWEGIVTKAKALKGNWTLSGNRKGGIIAAYAALFEPSIKEVIVINPPKSHKDGPHVLGVLRVLDIPEALGLLAPTPLTIIGGLDPAFDRTAEIYRRAGAADKLTRK